MSSEYRNREGYRGGRGRRGRERSSRGYGGGRGYSQKNKRENDKEEYLFQPQAINKVQKLTFETIKDKVVQTIQKTYRNCFDCAEVIDTGIGLDKGADEPNRMITMEQEGDIAEFTQRGLDIRYQEELRQWLDQNEILPKT